MRKLSQWLLHPRRNEWIMSHLLCFSTDLGPTHWWHEIWVEHFHWGSSWVLQLCPIDLQAQECLLQSISLLNRVQEMTNDPIGFFRTTPHSWCSCKPTRSLLWLLHSLCRITSTWKNSLLGLFWSTNQVLHQNLDFLENLQRIVSWDYSLLQLYWFIESIQFHVLRCTFWPMPIFSPTMLHMSGFLWTCR